MLYDKEIAMNILIQAIESGAVKFRDSSSDINICSEENTEAICEAYKKIYNVIHTVDKSKHTDK